MKLSLLVPVGRFSYFVHACLQNVFETCGAPDDLDFVFLTSMTVEPAVQMAFAEAAKTHPFRVLTAPFDAGFDHLQLLDWAVRKTDLTEWFIVQHCDLFWQEHNWLPRIVQCVRPDLSLLCAPCPSRYNFRPTPGAPGTNIPIVGDFFGAYNRKQLLERNLSFKWGTLHTEVQVSQKVIEAAQKGLIYRDKGNPRIVPGKEFMDGSQAMAWELAVHDPRGIGHVLSLDSFHHLVAFFRIADSLSRAGNTLRCNFPIGLGSYAFYSYLTSFCIDREEVEPVAIPWSVFSHIARRHGVDVGVWRQLMEWLRGYSRAKQVIGLDRLGLEQVDFNGQLFQSQDQSILFL
jgi:hypothetical protein